MLHCACFCACLLWHAPAGYAQNSSLSSPPPVAALTIKHGGKIEMKYDGFRLLAGVGGGAHPVLWTRNLNTVTSSYPEVADPLTAAFGGRDCIVLDGLVRGES